MLLLGSYGANGGFGSDTELSTVLAVIGIGNGCLLVVAVWDFKCVRTDWNYEVEHGSVNSEETHEELSTSTELSSFWCWMGFLITVIYYRICFAVFVDDNFETVAYLALPIALGYYVCCLLEQPRRRSPAHMWRLRVQTFLHVYVSEGALLFWSIRNHDSRTIAAYCLRICIWTFLLPWGLKLREYLADLPDKELETFLVYKLCLDGLKKTWCRFSSLFLGQHCVFLRGGNTKIV